MKPRKNSKPVIVLVHWLKCFTLDVIDVTRTKRNYKGRYNAIKQKKMRKDTQGVSLHSQINY